MFVEIRGKKLKVKGKIGSLSLKLSKKQIRDINNIKNLTSLSDLRLLDLSNNQISEIKGFENLSNLYELNLNNNKISQIKGFERLTNLKALQMQYNDVRKIEGLEKLTHLERLDLKSNLIEEIENLENLKNLNTIDLEGNPCYREFKSNFYRQLPKDKKKVDQAVLYYAKQPREKREEFKRANKVTVDDRKYYGIEMYEIVQKIDEYLETNYLNEKQIFYPIDEALLNDFSHIIKKEDILYSTLCKINYIQAQSSTLSSVRNVRWESPVLITRKGIAYKHFLTKKKRQYTFTDWIQLFWPKYIEALTNKKLKFGINNFVVIRDVKFESEQLFNERRNKFNSFCYLLCLRSFFDENGFFAYSNFKKFLSSRGQIVEYLLKKIIHLVY